jgi:putative membrane-bound dehydrogenase-like protein
MKASTKTPLLMPLMAGTCLLISATGIAVASSDIPQSPQEELATFHFADTNLAAELVAAEPDVIAPVALAWDADGRLYVAEMTDYPSGPDTGRIRMLEDRDGDGRYEHSIVFADKIAFPNGVMPWNDGLLVTAAPDILFFKDTNGDGRADERRVLLTGFAEGNQQLRVNGLYWGLDNWIYGANGRSDGDVRWIDGADLENNGAGAVSIRRRDFRFRPSTRQFEAVAGHSQFGTAHDDWANRFPVFNNIPIRHVVFEQHHLDRQPLLAGNETVVPISAPNDKGRVYHLAPPTLLIPQAPDYFTSACGPTVYRGKALGPDYGGNFFVCEPVHNLIQRRSLVPSGATFIAERTESGIEFLASADPWFHPVFTATGPDGALYVVDFYRKYVEHPQWVAEELKTTVPWRTGEEHGRLWRIRAKNWKPGDGRPNLNRASSTELAKHLTDANGWWRDTAQRLLVERQDRSVVAVLEGMSRKSPSPLARLHALYTLEGLNALSSEILAGACVDREPTVREHAIRLAGQYLAGAARVPVSPESTTGHRAKDAGRDRLVPPVAATAGLGGTRSRQMDQLTTALLALVDDGSPRVRFQLALTLGGIDCEQKLPTLARLAQAGDFDRWQALAILSSVGPRPWLLWKIFAEQNPKWLTAQDDRHVWFLDRLAALIVDSRDDDDLRESAAALGQDNLPPIGKMILLGNLAEAQKSNPIVGKLSSSDDFSQRADRISAEAERTALSQESALPIRVLAIRLLGRRPSQGARSLARLLLPGNPQEVQSATVNALGDANNPAAASLAIDSWERYTKSTRHELAAAASRSGALADALLAALEHGTVLRVEVDPSTRQALQKSSDFERRRRAEALFKGAVAADREQTLQRYKPALQMAGDRKAGAAIFAKTCLPCHAMQGEGNRVGPDLSGIATHARETLLVDVLDPSRQVSPDFVSYAVVTTEGEALTGLIATESTASITLRRPNSPDLTIQRSQIQELKADGKSLMPDGLEQGLSAQDMADLLSFLRQPDAALLPKQE